MLSTQHGDFKDLPRRTALDKVLRDKAFNIAKNLKYDGCHGGLASILYNFFNKKSSATRGNKFVCGAIENEIVSNQE